MKTVVREVTGDGHTVWGVVLTLRDAIHAVVHPPLSPTASGGSVAPSVAAALQAATVKAAATATAALESLTVLYAVDPVLGPLFRSLFEVYKRACYVDPSHVLAESDITAPVRDFIRESTGIERFDRTDEAQLTKEMRAYTQAVAKVDWGAWTVQRSTRHWQRSTPHHVYRERTGDTIGVIARDVKAFDHKLSLHRQGKPILRAPPAGGGGLSLGSALTSAVAAAAAGSATGAASGPSGAGVGGEPSSGNPATPSPSQAQLPSGGSAGEENITLEAARAAVDLRVVRLRVAFRGWGNLVLRQKQVNAVIGNWSGNRRKLVKTLVLLRWRQFATAEKAERRGQDLRLSEMSFAEERAKRLDQLTEIKSLERRFDSLWHRCQDAETVVRRTQADLEDLKHPMVWDFRRPIVDAVTGQEWQEGTLRFRRHNPTDDDASATYGYADLFFDLDLTDPAKAELATNHSAGAVDGSPTTQSAAEATLPGASAAESSLPTPNLRKPQKSYYVIRMDDVRPGGTGRATSEPTFVALNDALLALAKNAWRDRRKAFTQTQQKALQGYNVSADSAHQRSKSPPGPRSPRAPGLIGRIGKRVLTLRTVVTLMKAAPLSAHSPFQASLEQSPEAPSLDEIPLPPSPTDDIVDGGGSESLTVTPSVTELAARASTMAELMDALVGPIAVEYGEFLADKQDGFEGCWMAWRRAQRRAREVRGFLRLTRAPGPDGEPAPLRKAPPVTIVGGTKVLDTVAKSLDDALLAKRSGGGRLRRV
jgi:hypothetical protein